ncbi:hypothetical protein AB0B57_19535 [Micromonospora sp. NPDC049101]|uniref:hypothetical protein n=1 Tax=Micromonospora sp. NPDC049101 TaxID=3155032 RepID=UPI0034017A66
MGSTSIHGMAAKPVFDLQVSVADLDAAVVAFDEPVPAHHTPLRLLCSAPAEATLTVRSWRLRGCRARDGGEMVVARRAAGNRSGRRGRSNIVTGSRLGFDPAVGSDRSGGMGCRHRLVPARRRPSRTGCPLAGSHRIHFRRRPIVRSRLEMRCQVGE